MEINQSVPAVTVAEFIAYAKSSPGKINFASAGIGTAPHLAGELFQAMTGVKMVHVPYRGEPPAISDLLAGRVQVMFGNVTASIEHIRSGALRALAVTTTAPSGALPNVPTVGETVPGYEASGWFGVGVPKGTPTEVIEKLSKEINAGLADPIIMSRLADLGSTVLPLSPADLGKLAAEETEKWGKVIRAANIKPE
jgi:tripartite-type tricarboxylate transporter receptor subunit TctC